MHIKSVIAKFTTAVLFFSSSFYPYDLSALDLDKAKSLDSPQSFRISMREDVASGGVIPLAHSESIPLRGYDRLPHVGVYTNPQYLCEQSVVIQMEKNLLLQNMPLSLLRALIAEYEPEVLANDHSEAELRVIASESIPALLENAEFYLIASGRPHTFHPASFEYLSYNGDAAGNRIYNALFHVWALDDYAPPINVKMGVFDPSGVQPSPAASIAFEVLADTQVNLHPDGNNVHAAAWSPNNARFSLEAGRVYHSYWAVAHHGERTVITYQVLVSSEASEEMLKVVAASSFTLGNLIESFPEVTAACGESEDLSERHRADFHRLFGL
ncbi:MAG: hypothetical protein ACI9S8_002787 [Chlamydiales bacterium]|jgi:hypothetical protein